MRINKREADVTQPDKRTGRKQVTERQPAAVTDTDGLTLQEAVDFVIKVKRANNLKDRTLDGYKQNMAYFLDWVAERHGQLVASDVTIDILRDYVLWCAEEKSYYGGHPFREDHARGKLGLSPASVNVRIRVLRTFFAVLYEEDVIERNPAAKLSLMRQDVDTVEPLTEDELRRLLRAPDQKYFAQFRDYVIMILIIDTGMRLNEICALEIEEVDFQTKQIVLPAAKNKNRKQRRLPLSTETVRLLKQLIKETNRHFPDTKYVFTTNYGDQLSDKSLQKSIAIYAERAKINRSVSPHRLRHNFATMAALNGMDIFSLMKMMGHADIATTRKYVQVSSEDLADQHKRFSPLGKVLKRK